MGQADRYFVALSPARDLDAGILKRVAEILGTDAYNARLLVAGEMPRIIAQFPSPEPALALARELTSLGLSAVSGSQQELLREYAPTFIAHSLRPGEPEVTFQDIQGETRKISQDSVFLILEGELPVPEAERQEVRTERKFNLQATLALGGIPVWRNKQIMVDKPGTYARFLRLYSHSSPEPLVEMRSGDFDYSSLGAKKGLSSTENFSTIGSELRGKFPRAVFDNRLTRTRRGSLSPFVSAETLEQYSRLIYMFYLVAAGESARTE